MVLILLIRSDYNCNISFDKSDKWFKRLILIGIGQSGFNIFTIDIENFQKFNLIESVSGICIFRKFKIRKSTQETRVFFSFCKRWNSILEFFSSYSEVLTEKENKARINAIEKFASHKCISENTKRGSQCRFILVDEIIEYKKSILIRNDFLNTFLDTCSSYSAEVKRCVALEHDELEPKNIIKLYLYEIMTKPRTVDWHFERW